MLILIKNNFQPHDALNFTVNIYKKILYHYNKEHYRSLNYF